MSGAVREYLDYATIHGLGRLKNSPFLVLRVLWVVFLCCSLAMITFQFVLLWDKYQSYPISTSIEMKTPSQLAFPVVTICNTNPVNFDAVYGMADLWNIIDQASRKYSIDIDMFNQTDEYDSRANISSEPIENDILWLTGDRFDMAFNELLTFDELTNMSQSFEEFAILCTYNGVKCSREAIEAVRTYEYGICYNIFPELMAGRTSRMVSAAGKRYGLELLLYTDEVQSIPFVTHSSGVFVAVHDGETGTKSMYLPDGVLVHSGFEADIQVSKVQATRDPGKDEPPRCSESFTPLSDCIKNCQQKHIALLCDCRQVPFDSPYGKVNEFLGVYWPCSTEDDYHCIEGVLDNFINEIPESCSECRTPCSESYYETKASETPWPSENVVPILRRILGAFKLIDPSAIDRDYVRRNIAMVRIYLSSLTYQSITEENSYSAVNFASDLGGTLGLWAGFSALSLLEIFELLVILCASKYRTRNEVSSTSINVQGLKG